MAAAVMTPHTPLGPTLLMGGGQEAEAASHLLKSPDDYRRELMIEYALAEYSYVITEDEADEIFANPDWWEDVDAFVEYMQEVNFGTSIAGTTNVALPRDRRLLPPTPMLSPASSSGDDNDDSSDTEEDEDEEEPLPLYELQLASGESPAKSPPTYMESVDAIFEALGQELEMLGLVHHEEQQQPEIPMELEEDEPENEQLATLSHWLGSLTDPVPVPTTPRASIDVSAAVEEEEAEVKIIDFALALPHTPLSPVVLAFHEAVQVTMAAATPALVDVARPKRRPPPPPTRRERFERRVLKATGKLARGLAALSCSSGPI
ncbi:hypothetical protein PG996_006407 [Apiospora saccharicola]|uniref:Uncharacterized protein n=1 Tax=Apiospora saccharicola TaxID=335842 RepID=A0ABR1VP75_9PEZI